MSSRLWILIISLLLIPVSCKQEAPAKKQAAEDTTTPPADLPPATLPDTDDSKEDEDDCGKNSKKDTEDKDTDEDTDEDTEEEDEMELRLTGPTKTDASAKADSKVKAKASKKSHKKSAKVKKAPESNGFSGLYSGFGLLASGPNYDDDISSILKDKCESCHSGSDSNAMDTYKKAKALKNKIKSAISSGDMPPENKSPLTSSEKTAIKNWVAAGAPETSDDVSSGEEEGEEEEEEDSSSSSTTDCGDDKDDDSKDDDDDDDSNSSDNKAAWDELLKKKEVEKCKDKGKIFDRLTETCHKAKVAGFTCDKSGVEAQFKKVGVNVSSQIEGFLSDGYSIDQCGEFSNEPIVLFYKKETVKEELKLLIKKLCKKGSSACDN